MHKNLCKFILVTLSFYSLTSYANNADSLSSNLQSTLNHYLANEGKKEGVTGMAATVSYHDKNTQVKQTFVAGVIGYSPYNKKPVTKDTLFEIGSITKSFTSVLILQLEAEGLLNLDDKIGRWLPQYPNWKNVTIRQLLNMTSGIPSYSRNTTFQKQIYGNIRSEFSDQQLIEFADPNKKITTKTKFDYSNTNYILAGMIVEAITKHNFAEELRTRLLDRPYKLKNTYYVAGKDWKAVRTQVMPRMAHGYYYDDETRKMVDATDSNLSWGGPAGGMVSDTQDITDWVQVLYHGLAIPENSRKHELKQLETLVSMQTGKPITNVTEGDKKGFGLGVGALYDNKAGRFWVYEGSGMGFRMMYIWKPCNNVSVVAVLNNKAGEGGSNVNGGDHIQELVLNLYQNLMKAHPELNCQD